jgi:tetratricopeptide (TPR) repeat protein
MYARIVALVGLLLAAWPAALPAQHGHTHAGASPEKLGRVVFPVSCTPEARERFGRAMALLHSFWWAEAQRAFDAVAEADPHCAMAHWGKAMTHLGNPFAGPPPKDALRAGLAEVEKAIALNPPTPRERGYVEAAAALFREHEQKDHRTRMAAHEEAMRALSEAHPDDPEAAVFHARALIANAPPTDRTYQRQKLAGEILEPLFQRAPEHPGLAHYLIHTYDAPPLARNAVHAARQYDRIAPSVPHARHMPSHIFTRLGMWDASIRANRGSADAAKAYEEATGAKAVSMDRVHAWDYLVYAYLQKGEDRSARRLVEEARGITAAPGIGTDYALAAIPARLAVERGAWGEAAGLVVRPSPAFRAGEAVTHFARGVGSARISALALARADLAALTAIRDELRARNDAGWAHTVEAQRLALAAWVARGEARAEEALRLAAEAADLEEQQEKHPVTPGPLLPARELQGDLLLEAGRPAEALRAYEANLTREPNRSRSVFGAARAAELAGERLAARTHYRAYLRLMSGAEEAGPEIRAARAFLGRR